MRIETGNRGSTAARRPIAHVREGLAVAGAFTVMAASACSTGGEPNGAESSAEVSQMSRGDVPTEEHPDLEAVFEEAGVEGTFALHDVRAGTAVVVEATMAHERAVPGTTFEVPNSLVALETGEVSDVDEPVEHGDSGDAASLREALSVSDVDVQRELADRVGPDSLHTWVDRFDYGNRALDEEDEDGHDWLEGPLEISATEQTVFLSGLARSELPVEAEHQQALHEVMLRDQVDGYSLYSTGGWDAEAGLSSGWWIGWVEGEQDDLHTFALRLEAEEEAQMELREPLGRELLAELGVLPG